MRCLDGHHLSKSCSGLKSLSNKQGSKKLTGFNKNIKILEEKKKKSILKSTRSWWRESSAERSSSRLEAFIQKSVQQLKARGRRLKSNVTCDTIIQPGTSEGWTCLRLCWSYRWGKGFNFSEREQKIFLTMLLTCSLSLGQRIRRHARDWLQQSWNIIQHIHAICGHRQTKLANHRRNNDMINLCLSTDVASD